MRPLTDTLPKCLVPIRGTPLLAIWLQLLETAGVSEALVTVRHEHERVEDFLQACRTSVGVRVIHEPRPLGSAGAVVASRDHLARGGDFLILYADVLTNVDLRRMIGFHAQHSSALTLGVTVTDRPTEKGTVVTAPDGRVLAFDEKAAEPRSNLANAGIYVARQALFRYLPAALPDGSLDFGYHVLPGMVPDVMAYRIEEFLLDIGTMEAYQRAQADWPGPGTLGPSAS